MFVSLNKENAYLDFSLKIFEQRQSRFRGLYNAGMLSADSEVQVGAFNTYIISNFSKSPQHHPYTILR